MRKVKPPATANGDGEGGQKRVEMVIRKKRESKERRNSLIV